MQEKMVWCVACTFLLGKCTKECVFAPYCPPEDPLKFLMMHNMFEIAKMLNDLPVEDRKNALISLFYEAITRLKDPLSACVSAISVLQEHRRQLQNKILYLRKELSTYVGPAAASALPHPHNSEQALHNQHISAAISNYEQQEIWNSMFGMDGGEGSIVLTVAHWLFNLVDGMSSSSNNPFGAQLAESDHQNPQVSPTAAGAASVHRHHLSLQQQILQHQQQPYLQQQQGQVSPVHLHHLSLQQQQEGQEPALHLKDAEDDKHGAGQSI